MVIDLYNNLSAATSLAPAAYTQSTDGTGVDLQGYDGAMVLFNVGTVTDGTHTPAIEESDDNQTFGAVAAGDQQGSFAGLASNVNQKVGYLGIKRYIRAKVTIAGGPQTGGVYSAAIIRGAPRKAPV